MKTLASKSAAILFALSLGFGTAYAAMGENPAEKCDSGKPAPTEKCGEGKRTEPKAASSAEMKCAAGKCGGSKCDQGKTPPPKSDARNDKGRCG